MEPSLSPAGQVQRLMPSRGGVTVPDHGLDAADDSCAHQNLRHRAKLSIKQADDALVTGEQVRHVLRRQVVNREQVAGT